MVWRSTQGPILFFSLLFPLFFIFSCLPRLFFGVVEKGGILCSPKRFKFFLWKKLGGLENQKFKIKQYVFLRKPPFSLLKKKVFVFSLSKGQKKKSKGFFLRVLFLGKKKFGFEWGGNFFFPGRVFAIFPTWYWGKEKGGQSFSKTPQNKNFFLNFWGEKENIPGL